MKPIGKTVRVILLSLLVPTLCAATAWADVTDSCANLSGPGSYQNLVPPDRDYIGWDSPPDSSYICQQSNRRAASVVYRCSDAREVTVAIYSRHGCYAVYEDGQLIRGGDELPLWYQSSTGEVYCDGRRMVYDAQQREFTFLEEEGSPSGLVEYGLSVYRSTNGSDYDRVSTRLVSAWREGPNAYWYEVYRADLPEGTRYLRLELTDQSSIEIPGREERYQFETVGGLSLASVEIIEEESSTSSQETDREWEDEWDDWDDWDDWMIWEEGEIETFQTDGLPSYQPGEEEGPESLPWGPEEDPEDGGPAFPEEIEGQEDWEPEKSSSGSGSSSSSGSSAASSKSQSQQKKSSTAKGQSETAQEISAEPSKPTETVRAAAAIRREVPLWRRITEPDAMSMIIIAFVLLAMGIRILWSGGDDPRNSYEKREAAARQEARYARYQDYDGAFREDPEDR